MHTAPPPCPELHASAAPEQASPSHPLYPQPGQVQWVGHPPFRHNAQWTPTTAPKAAPRPAPLRSRELAAALAIVVACDIALYSTQGGLAAGGFGMGLFFLALPVALAVATRAWRGSVRLGVVVALLAAVAGRCFFDPTPGTVLAGLGLLGAFTLTLRARRMFVPEALVSMLSAIQKAPSRIGAAIAGGQKLVARTRVGKISLLPIVIPLALCAVFAGVFALGNPVVAHGLAATWSAITSVISLPSPVRIFVWVSAFVLACSLLRPALRLAKGSEAAAETGEATGTSLLVARNALGALNVLFLLYNTLDAAYLWSGAPPAGMHTQQYAHEGAFWLTIALVMLTGVIGFMFRGPLAHDARGKTTRLLAYVWMGQGLVLALGTYRRIAIHVTFSGLSDLRIVGILGTTLVLAGLGMVALKLRRRLTFGWLVRRQLDAFALALVFYSVFPTHLVSARVNVARIEGGEYRPVLHMFRQSSHAESAATLVPLLHHPDVRVRQGVAALLEQEHSVLAADVGREHSWRQRDVASRRTLAALDEAGPEIAATLGTVNRSAARQVLLEISRVANESRSLEELLAVPDAAAWDRDGDRNQNVRSTY